MRLYILRFACLVGALGLLGIYNTTLGCGGSTENETTGGASGNEASGGTGSSSSSSSGGSGTASTNSDTDGDGTVDATDTDDDGDNIPDTDDPDSASTSTAAAPDADADGDGTANATDTDDDGDGANDGIDPDDDNDGVADSNESGGTANPDLKGLNTQLVVGVMDAMEPHFPEGDQSGGTTTEPCGQGGSVTITTGGDQSGGTTSFAFSNCREDSKAYPLSDGTNCSFTTLVNGNFSCAMSFQSDGNMKVTCQTDGALCGAKIVAGIGETISQNIGINLATDLNQQNEASNFSGNACVAGTEFPIDFENALADFSAADVSCK
ncbi:MAG: hypothetical protein HY696_09510 [Deltaproteobacteria bacterium]|nr:hypothetical protein [Deltaproteobacteria bacterium]